ncbi:MAG: 50S ribosomal protein L23 [Fusobacteria bacterium]|nr:50S ribosomal protein L23 [Fusobacteriota bacterium]
MNMYDVIKKPVVSEKSELMRRETNRYTFIVDKAANKVEIRQAVEAIFSVKVKSVNTLNIKPENAKYGQNEYKTKLVKKAIVELQAGDSIKYFEGV